MSEIYRTREYEQAFWTRFPLPQALVDKKGVFTAVNPAWSKLLGYSQSELVGQSWKTITHPADIGSDEKESRRLTTDEESDGYSMVKRYISKSGSSVWVELHVSAIREQGVLVEYAVTVIPLPDYDGFKVEPTNGGYAVRPSLRWIDLVRDNPRETFVIVGMLIAVSGRLPFENLVELIKLTFGL